MGDPCDFQIKFRKGHLPEVDPLDEPDTLAVNVGEIEAEAPSPTRTGGFVLSTGSFAPIASAADWKAE